MPKVFIEMLEGRTLEQKRLMAEKVTDAMVESLGVKRESVLMTIRENKKENLAKGGKLLIDLE